MVSWSLETLVLALYVITILCSIYIAVKAMQARSFAWAPVFLLGPVVFWFLSGYVGALIAGLLVIAAQFWYVKQPYNWGTWGRIYVYVVLCWAGSTVVTSRERGWVPERWLGEPEVMQAAAPVPTATEALLDVDGGRIWYRRSGTGQGTPVVLVHGGPGFGSFYLKPLEALGDERPVIRYDQLGAGRSDRATDATLFTIERYVAELESLRAALGVERMHVVGHSWGSQLAFEYYRAHPERVASLTLASPSLSVPQWTRNARRLLATISEESQRVIAETEATADYDSPDYQRAVEEFYARYVWLRPVQADLDSSMAAFGQPSYAHMWGPSEFTVTGTLRSYDATRQLRRIAVPTLYAVGEVDEADTATVRRFASLTPGARFAVIPDAAHILTWDNPDETLRVVREFLRAVDVPPADTTRAPDNDGTG